MFKKASDAHRATKAAAAAPAAEYDILEESFLPDPPTEACAQPARGRKVNPVLPPLGKKSKPGKVAAFKQETVARIAVGFYIEELGPSDSAHMIATRGMDYVEKNAKAYESLTRSFLMALRKEGIEVP